MTDISRSNRKRYRASPMVRKYQGPSGLFPAETQILAALAPTIHKRPVLDLGVGTGRTAPDLATLSGDYLGLDYAPRMIQAARKAHPDLRFAPGDARNLAHLPAEHFALVLFSFNGLDYIDHTGRMRALAEIRRVLAPGGYFVFSSHNAAFTAPPPYARSRFVPSPNPLRTLVRLGHYLMGCLHYLRLRPALREGADWSLRVVGERNFSVVAYHIRPQSQVAELETAGFSTEALYAFTGEGVSPEKTESLPWIYYLARKPPRDGSRHPPDAAFRLR